MLPQRLLVSLTVTLFCVTATVSGRLFAPSHSIASAAHSPNYPRADATTHPTSADCIERWFSQPVDHFTYFTQGENSSQTWEQRYFVCNNTSTRKDLLPSRPLFFYTGNEADVTLYVNATGLMWENAPTFGALLVFAEHRFYGESLPFGTDSESRKEFLSSEQALADYARLITFLKESGESGLHQDSAVIAFGGSYGGMLSSWFRMKYPHIVAGAIAASAPIRAFPKSTNFNPNSFYQIITDDASEKGGASNYCEEVIRSSWSIMQTVSMESLQRYFKLCDEPKGENDVLALMNWVQNAYSYMAMGNYPYPSSYILNGAGELPAFPMRVACEGLDFNPDYATADFILSAMSQSVGVYYNYSNSLQCYDLSAGVNNATKLVGEMWNYQFCTEMWMPMSTNGVVDMFWSSPWNATVSVESCLQQYNVKPRQNWITTFYGGNDLSGVSNIVFSNGAYDPWSGTGVRNNISDSVTAILIPEGAHHLDLMWSNPMDPPAVLQARAFEVDQIAIWIQNHNQNQFRER